MRRAVAVALLLVSGLLFGAAPQTEAEPRVHEVTLSAMKFTPASLTVREGEVVVWKNDDLVPHTVAGEGFLSPVLLPGQTFKWKAGKRGSVPYACTLHPMMQATLVVE